MKPETPPTETGCQETRRDHTGKEEKGTPKITTGTPRPAAKAADAQEPEPKPAKQRDEEEDGNKPAGQAPDGKTKRTGEGEPAKARTKATDRATKAHRPRPKKETRKTEEANGRAIASTPAAQPQETTPSAPANGTTREASTAAEEPATREPQTPKEKKDDKIMTNLLYLFIKNFFFEATIEFSELKEMSRECRSCKEWST